MSSATPPPAANCDEAVAVASAIVMLDKCTVIPSAKMAPPYCGIEGAGEAYRTAWEPSTETCSMIVLDRDSREGTVAIQFQM
eukprot:2507021-Prymnesium_polylepis.1